jgi:hypothetical protein
MSCASRAEADEWANAIRNNVAALPKEAGKYYTTLMRLMQYVRAA